MKICLETKLFRGTKATYALLPCFSLWQKNCVKPSDATGRSYWTHAISPGHCPPTQIKKNCWVQASIHLPHGNITKKQKYYSVFDKWYFRGQAWQCRQWPSTLQRFCLLDKIKRAGPKEGCKTEFQDSLKSLFSLGRSWAFCFLEVWKRVLGEPKKFFTQTFRLGIKIKLPEGSNMQITF